jgi:hypothetical protein
MVLLVSYFLLYKRQPNEGLDAQSAKGDGAFYGERFYGIIMSEEWSLTAMEGGALLREGGALLQRRLRMPAPECLRKECSRHELRRCANQSEGGRGVSELAEETLMRQAKAMTRWNPAGSRVGISADECRARGRRGVG